MKTFRRPSGADAAPEEISGLKIRQASAEIAVAGVSVLVCGIGLIAAALVDLTDGGTDSVGLAVVGILAVGIGVFSAKRVPVPSRLTPRRSLRTVGIGLLSMIALSILAYRVTGTITRPGEALMESTAGFTTTALTVIEDPEAQTRGILFWRATTQWLGGFGALAAVIAVLPFLGVSGPSDPRARLPTESPHLNSGHVRRVLSRYFLLYCGLTGVGATLFLIGGMGPFDAVTYAFTTISTGGFANHAGSFSFFDSALIEWMGVAGMFLGGLSLAVVWSVLRGRSRALIGSRELWAYCGLIAAATAVIAAVQSPGHDFLSSVRISAFTAASAVSSTGHWVADWAEWAPGPQWILVLLIGLGAMSGSMGGGFRIVRGMALFSYLWRELDTQLRPGVVRVVRVGREAVDEPRMSRILGYQVLYIGAAAAGFVALTMAGTDLVTAMSGSLSALATYGPALGELGVGEPLAALGRPALVILLVLMFAGRVELYPLLDGSVAVLIWPLRRLRSLKNRRTGRR
ncbi:MAG: TrkH family potassium uptake protein [Actinomycetia bacterium]|nr:TrkH family potassium uptake protein [Actinomycetes bacterium]